MTYGDYPNLNGVKKILVIKLRQLGDVLLTSPVFSVLKKRFPEAEIHGYVYSESVPMLEGLADGLIAYDRNWKKLGLFGKLKKELTLLRKIRKGGFDLVINLTEGDRGALAAKAAKAPVRVGFKPKGKWQKKLYTHVVKDCPTLRHTVERNLDALRRIGIFPEPHERELFFDISSAESRVKEMVDGPYILIHPASRWRFKCWPVEKMRELTQVLIERGKRVVFTSGPDELDMVDAITDGLDVIHLGGKVTLKELGALIQKCECLVCVDSVPFHMASALKKRVVAIFGPTSEVTWGPWRNPNARIVTENVSCRPCYMDGCGGSKMSDCIQTVSVQKVLALIDSFKGGNLLQDMCGALEDR